MDGSQCWYSRKAIFCLILQTHKNDYIQLEILHFPSQYEFKNVKIAEIILILRDILSSCFEFCVGIWMPFLLAAFVDSYWIGDTEYFDFVLHWLYLQLFIYSFIQFQFLSLSAVLHYFSMIQTLPKLNCIIRHSEINWWHKFFMVCKITLCCNFFSNCWMFQCLCNHMLVQTLPDDCLVLQIPLQQNVGMLCSYLTDTAKPDFFLIKCLQKLVGNFYKAWWNICGT